MNQKSQTPSMQNSSRNGKNAGVLKRLGVPEYFTWYSLLGLAALIALTGLLAINRFEKTPVLCCIALVVWLAPFLYAQYNERKHHHSAVSHWLYENLFSSAVNTVLNLLVFLILITVGYVFWDYAIYRATFDPNLTAPGTRPANVGASWGVVIGAAKLILTGTLEMEFLPRVWAAFWATMAMAMITILANWMKSVFQKPIVKKTIMGLWVLLIPSLYVLLVGVSGDGPFIDVKALLGGEAVVLGVYALLYWQKVINFNVKKSILWVLAWPVVYLIFQGIGTSQLFPVINVDHWGGLLLTLVITVFSIVVSFPLGVALALGRRSTVRGIPSWFTLTVCAALTLWGLATSTPEMFEKARSSSEKVVAFWPLLIMVAGILFQRSFKGNVISATSTLYIEVVRGVPLITILFMAIVMAPLFYPEGIKIKNTWAVLAGYTLFNAAYLAEVVRGGLQAIPMGQYEAADSLGLNGLQKMRFIILPQALTIVIPAMVGLFVGVFKSSSLVGIVGLFDLMGIVGSITGNPRWQGLRTELYILVAFIYFVGSISMTSYSRRLEKRLASSKR